MSNEIPGYIRAAILSAILVAAAVWVPVSAATAEIIPPDFSAVDQYTEGYPGVGGNEQPSVDSAPNGGSSLPEETVERFNRAGPVGIAAATLALLTAPSRISDGPKNVGHDRDNGMSIGSSGLDATTPAGEGGLEVIRQAIGVSGPGGMGLFLPIILIVASVLAVGYSVSRKRA